MRWLRDLFVWATKAVAARLLGSVVMALLAGTEVRALFVGVGPRLGFSFVPNAVGVLSGIAILALFLFLLRVWPRHVPKMQPAARLPPTIVNPSIAQIVSEVRDHKERVAAAIRDEADAKLVKCERCGKQIPKWFSCEMPDEGMEKRSFWLKTHRDLKWTPEQREAFIRYGGFGCMRCAGTAQAYPADGETKEEFTKRVLNTQLTLLSPNKS
jgi:hypothetical protein